MQESLRQPTLNAVKAFEAAARLGSLKAAATALRVSSSAVSHQVRQLEDEIGKRLFTRRNNAIELTREGYRLFQLIGPALRTIARATEEIRIDTKVVALNVSNAFALLWLIPRLADFQKRHPRIAVEMDTVRRPVVLDDSVEMAIFFARPGSLVSGAIELVKDFSMPMAATGLWRDRNGRARDIRAVPLISSTPDDWDWRLWASQHDVDYAQLRVAYRFDCECAASAACRAGLGVALLNTVEPRRSRLRAARWFPLAPLGGSTPVVIGLLRPHGCAALPRSSRLGCSRWRRASRPTRSMPANLPPPRTAPESRLQADATSLTRRRGAARDRIAASIFCAHTQEISIAPVGFPD